MRIPLVSAILLALAAGPVLGQGDSVGPPGGARLRERIEHRFGERVKEELDLSDEQAAKLKAVAKENGGLRRALRQRERSLTAALEEQLRPGVAANQDSVARLTKELLDLRVEYAESWRDEVEKLDFLTPVQRARLMVMRERLLKKVHEMRGERRGFRHRGDAH
jgi:hypothetical protein